MYWGKPIGWEDQDQHTDLDHFREMASYGIATTETKMISHLQDQRPNDLPGSAPGCRTGYGE